MPHYRGTLTLELWFQAEDQQHAEERIDAIAATVERQHPEVMTTLGASECEAARPEGWDLAMAEAGV